MTAVLRYAAPFWFLLLLDATAYGQFRGWANIHVLNARLDGHVDDYTHNHGHDRRIASPILGMPRDLYVYTPPGYSPRTSYPLILYFHMSDVDEHTFSGSDRIVEVDRMIRRGEMPPVIVACPDGTYSGKNRLRSAHSFYVNGLGGRMEDHVMQEVLPFLTAHYAIRPERQAHALLGASAGGFGALNLAIKHRDVFGAVATLSSPVNLRYDTCSLDALAHFDPATYRWRTVYDPDEIIGVFPTKRTRAREFAEPVFGDGPEALAAITRENPADLIFSTALKPSELAIYLHFAGRDNYNFDAHAQSFAWLAASRGIAVELGVDPHAEHRLPYFIHNHRTAYAWLGRHLLPPAARP